MLCLHQTLLCDKNPLDRAYGKRSGTPRKLDTLVTFKRKPLRYKYRDIFFGF